MLFDGNEKSSLKVADDLWLPLVHIAQHPSKKDDARDFDEIDDARSNENHRATAAVVHKSPLSGHSLSEIQRKTSRAD